jgi:hypothetical protein
MRRIDAQDVQLGGEELQLFQRQAHQAIFRVALDVGIELRGVERAIR